ncbi:hypothetical protein HDF23_000411 [Mucilaginibacter lappiensis]|uniref:Uncharacterized protein n=1 Tax=Mucilaginibacter lappiensis TaxID=354630 RepID=A0ABR6PD49_9SPHI|nr:hypothetical protein [Mucilaginibacter lappiensis]MBB6107681.1 hypothetical protein [Mucilaginibacter lappiensis]
MTNEERVTNNTFEKLLEFAGEYGKIKGVTLDLEQAKDKYFKINQNDRLEYYNTRLAIYTLENLPIFEFLLVFGAFSKNSDLLISATVLAAIHEHHSALFTNTPALTALITNKVFQSCDSGTNYSVHCYYHEQNMGSDVVQHAATLLWEKLITMDSFKDDTERLQFWYYRIVYHNDHNSLCSTMPAGAKDRFLNAAVATVLNETDLENGKAEYDKLRLDHHHTDRESIIPEYYVHSELSSIPDDLYEVYQTLIGLNHGHGADLIIEQGCRHGITYLITELVANDKPFKFENTSKLLELADSKPYAFWYTCFLLYYWHPEILPFLIKEEKTAGLGFRLLFEAGINKVADSGKVKACLIQESFGLLLNVLSNDSIIPDDRKAVVIFQCIEFSTGKKFQSISNNRAFQDKHRAEQMALSDKLRELFAAEELPGVVYSKRLKFKKLFYPKLLDKLFDLIGGMEPESNGNGLIGLYHLQLDLMAWVINLSLRKDQEGKQIKKNECIVKYLRGFVNSYLKFINCKEVQKLSIDDGMKWKPGLPSWVTRVEQDDLIDWGKLFLLMEKNYLFDEFLSPDSLKFSNAESEYDDENQLAGRKLRNHISILIKGYNEIQHISRTATITGYPVGQVLNKIESKLATLITRYSKFEPASLRYDIFNESLERWTFGGKSEELLPLIGSVINKFSKENRQSIIRELTKSDHLIRSLKMIEYIVGEDEKKTLLNVVLDEQNIQQIMDKLSYADKQFVIQSLTQSPEFIKQAEDALKDTENTEERRRISHHQFEDEIFHLRANLLIAYHNHDLEKIESLQGPERDQYSGRQFSASQEKKFYEGLIYLDKKEAEKAYAIFNNLLSLNNTDKPTFALNRFASHLVWAGQIADQQERLKKYNDALDEWNGYQSQIGQSDNIDYISEKISINKLEAYEALTDDENFDRLYHELEKETRFKPHFLQIRIKNLMRRKMQAQAEALLQDARTVHALGTGGFPPFIANLEELANTPETINFLAEQHNRILSLPPDKLVQVITGNGLAVETIAEFLLSELLEACNQMLLKINSVSDVHYEDKYSDLLMLVLNGRLQHFHWKVNTLRGGFSDKQSDEADEKAKDDSKAKSNVGEIDFGFYASKGELLGICEALIVEGRNTTEVQKHNLKVFNYDPARKIYFMATYYQGDAENFNAAWSSYKDVVQNFIEFPADYELKDKLKEIDHVKTNASLKLATSEHGTETILYHIFVNINYKLELTKKKVREVRQAEGKK